VPEIPEDKIRKVEQLSAGRAFDMPDDSQDDAKATVLVNMPSVGNPSRDLNPGVMFGKNYQIIELVGKGGMSAVYKAYDRMLKRNVAVKVLAYKRKLDKKARARFVQEGIALSKLDHPNLIKVYEFGDADSAEPFLVMDFLEGVPLSEVMAPKKALPAFRAVSIVKQCVDALRHAHNKGVVHRDLKPSNVMLVEDPDTKTETAKIIDFGIAKVDEADSQRLTETGEVFGSPLYMSPEQCRGERLDERSDMYSLGCMFYELLTGKAPFVGVDFADTVGMHFNEDPKPLAQARPDLGCAEELDLVINKLMAKSRKDRYQTMGDVSEDLQPIFDKLKIAYRESKAKEEAENAALSEAKAVAAAAAQESKTAAAARKAAEAKKAAENNGGAGNKLATTLQERTPGGKVRLSKRKKLAALALILIVGFTAKEVYDAYSGIKKNAGDKDEPVSISAISQTSKELVWWQEDMDRAEKFFDRGNYFAAYEHFRKALKTAESIKDDNRSQIMGITLEHMIDLCYVISKLNHGNISDTEKFEDNSNEYKDALKKVQPPPNREEMLSQLQQFTSAESPDAESSSHLSDNQKLAAVKIAAISTELALSAPTVDEALSLFEKANKHIKMLMRNKVPDFAELLVKQSQYLAGIGKSKEAAILLDATSNAMSEESDILTRDRAMLKYAQACLFWQMNDIESAKATIAESAEEAALSGPETLKLITSATLELMNQRQKASNREINALLPILRNQLPRQYWLIAQALRLSAEGALVDIQAIVTFQQGVAYDVGASGQLKELSDDAEAKLKRSIAVLSRSRPYDKREIMKSYQDLSDTYLAARQFDDLEDLLPTVIEYGEQIAGFNPMELAVLTHNLGYLKQKKKDYAEAEALYRKTIDILGAEGNNSKTETLSKVVLADFNSLMQATGRENEKIDVIPVRGQK
jgi:tRNA A-37 threonylcarbamoyl transferase component Bud32